MIEEFVLDDRVSHDSHGLGRVVGVDAGGVTVDFSGTKIRVTTPFRKMAELLARSSCSARTGVSPTC